MRPLSRRQRRLLAALLPAILAVAAVAAVLYWPSRGEAPYVPGAEVEGITAQLERTVPEDFTPVRFTDVTEEAGIDFRHFHGTRSTQLPEDMGSGLAWGDYDGDGDPDLFLVNEAGPLTERERWPASPASHRLLRNEGGRFTDVTEAAGVGARELGMAAAWADVEGDGDLDLLVTSFGGLRLHRNEGDGSFTDVTASAGLDRPGYWSGAAWGDHDGDGDLDLYVTGYVRYELDEDDRRRTSSQYDTVIPATLNPSTYAPHPNVLFENDGRGRFTDVTERAGVANEEGRSLGAAWCDLDEDGLLDLYVANDISDNVLYLNRGGGVFEDSSHAAWVADYRGAMGLAVGDWDGDRDLDLFITHWIAQENALYTNLRRHRGRENAAARFVDDADRVGLGQVALDYVGWATGFLDFDLDGRLDLFVANGSTFQRRDQPSRLVPMRAQLFWNAGPEEGFFEVGAACGDYFREEHVGRGGATADFDGDGDVDLAFLNHGGRAVLLRNEGRPGHHGLGVRLRGRPPNTFGVGARVSVVADGRGQAQVVGATPSYLSQPELTLRFGLGASDEADRLVVEWPSGRRSELEGVVGDRVVVVEEPR